MFCIPSFLYTCTFLITFFGLFRYRCISCYNFLKDWSLKTSKLRKLHRKIWMRKNTDNLKMTNLKPLKELLYTLFETNFSNRWVTSLSMKILSEDFSNGILDEKWPIMMILEIFFLPIAGYKPAKGLFWSNMWETLSYKF